MLLVSNFTTPGWALDMQVYALFKDMVIVHIDGQQRKLRKNEVSPEGVKLIRASSEQAVLEYNGKQQTFSLGSHVSSSFPEVTRNEAMIWRQKGMYMSPGFINGQPVDFMVDTGASWIAMSSDQARQLGIDYSDQGEKGWASTANGVTPLYKITLDRVRVGDIELRHVEASVLENSNPRYILLGNSFLNRVEMSREGQMMLLREK
ncbi:MAG: retropepsin-like aspartic protease [Thioalkalispiraceae bacterium]